MSLEEPDFRSSTSSSAGGTAPSGEALFLTNLDLINKVIRFVCRRNHLNSSDADDFSSHARLQLMEDGCAVLRKFQGRSSLQTFLSITLQRVFLDYRTAAWGKWRPSAEALRGGPVAVLLEQLTGRDSYSFEEAFELITTNHQVLISRAELEKLAERLTSRPRRRIEGEEALANIPSNHVTDAAVADAERRRAEERIAAALEEELSRIPTQDRLLLRLRFDDGRSVAEIASMLQLEQKPLYARLQRIFRELRAGLERRGLGSEGLFDR